MSQMGQSRRFARFAARSTLTPKRRRRLDQLHSPQARMPVLADDDVIVHGNAQRLGDVDDGLGHLDVGLRGGGIA